MDMPTVEDLAAQLKDVSGADDVDVDTALQRMSDVDSLDLMEWLYNFQSTYPHIPADEKLFSDLDDTTTLRHVHDKIVALASRPVQA